MHRPKKDPELISGHLHPLRRSRPRGAIYQFHRAPTMEGQQDVEAARLTMLALRYDVLTFEFEAPGL
jgi:hypothetical protein